MIMIMVAWIAQTMKVDKVNNSNPKKDADEENESLFMKLWRADASHEYDWKTVSWLSLLWLLFIITIIVSLIFLILIHILLLITIHYSLFLIIDIVTVIIIHWLVWSSHHSSLVAAMSRHYHWNSVGSCGSYWESRKHHVRIKQ